MQVPQHPGITATHGVHCQPTPSNGSVGPVQPNQAPPAVGSVQGPPTGANATGSSLDRQQVLRHKQQRVLLKQQRMLLLRHASSCPHEDNRCPETPHCASMKRLWKHLTECKCSNPKCLFPHCVSSRYILSHYRRCQDAECRICVPVRETILRCLKKAEMVRAKLLQEKYSCTACPICLEEFSLKEGTTESVETKTVDPLPTVGSDGLPLKLLRCGHVFDLSCWESWVDKGKGNPLNCPLCRQDI